jgi:formate dehydrogenase iron-sulfur subunit
MNMKKWSLSPGKTILFFLVALGAILTLIRFIGGLGTVTNLNDGYPWGLWIGFDILAGIALAAGGFVTAGVVHIFGGRKYHALARPAILTAFLGYLLFIVALIIDLGRPWNIWRVLIHWNHHSPMFEVAWCVTLYTFVLALEFVPAVLEKFRLTKIQAIWNTAVPWLIIFMVTLFTLAMSGAWLWASAVFAVLLIWEMLMRKGVMPRDQVMPILLIMAGIIFSTMHQSSLGSLFLIVPHKLHMLWYSPILPLLFFVSAVMVAPAMVILEGLLSAKVYRREPELHLLRGLASALPYLLGIYLLLKLGDLIGKGAAGEIFRTSSQAVGLWLELLLILVPLIFLLTPEIKNTKAGLLWSSVLVILGIVVNRFNIAVTGITVKTGWAASESAPLQVPIPETTVIQPFATYYPSWMEFAITLGVVAAGLLVYDYVVKNFPVYEEA